MKKLLLRLASMLVLIAAPISLLFAQDQTDTTDDPGNYGANNPAGVSGIFNGNITTGCSYDPLTRNGKRVIDDIVVPGAISAYPLKMTRYYNTRTTGASSTMSAGWTHEYSWSGTPNGVITKPDGTQYGACPDLPSGVSDQWDPVYPTHFRLADGGTVVFQQVGTSYRVSQILDPFGKATTLAYNSSTGKLWTVTEPGGRNLEFIYTGDLLTTVKAWAGPNQANLIEQVSYSYTSVNNGCGTSCSWQNMLTGVQYDDQTSAVYTYVGDNNSDFTAPLVHSFNDVRYHGPMRYLVYEYVTSNHPAHGAVHKEKFDDTDGSRLSQVSGTKLSNSAQEETETRGDNATRTFRYAGYQCVPPQGEQCSPCDSQPQLLQWYTDFEGNTTYLGYDSNNFVNEVTDARGTALGTPPTYTTNYLRGPNIGEIQRITHPDPDGTFIQYDYYDPPSAPDHHYISAITDERRNWTRHYRDSLLRIYETHYYDAANNLLAYETIEYDDNPNAGRGQISKHLMKNGAYVHYRYDSRGLLTDKWEPTWSSSPVDSEPKTHYEYYTSGPWTDRVYRETDPRANITQYEYDRRPDNNAACPGRGLVTKITYVNDTHNGAYPSGTSRSFSYNQYGDKMSETNELGKTTSYLYDAYGRVLSVTDPLGHAETFNYTKPGTQWWQHTTNSVYTHTSRANIVTTNLFDNNWRKTSSTVGSAVTTFHYDAVGNQNQVTDPRNYTTYSYYDNRNRKYRIDEPLGHTTLIGYDYTSNVIWIRPPDYQVGPPRRDTTQYKWYDGLNRVTDDFKPQWDDGSSIDNIHTHFDYYPYNGSAGHSGSLLWKVTDGEGKITTFDYDPAGMKSTMTYPLVTGQSQADYQIWSYDANHNLIGRKTVNGAIQSFGYDSRDRKTWMRWSNSVDSSGFDYDGAGRLTSAINPSSTVTRAYDDADRMTLDQQTLPAASGTPIPTIDLPTVVSRKTHGSAGTFDIPLPLSGPPGIENRTGGSYTIVATFPQAVTFTNATVDSGTGTVSSATGSGSTQITVNLTGVGTAQKIVVKVAAVTEGLNSADVFIPMNVLWGDSNANGVVNSSDTAQIESRIGQTVTSSNFRSDVNASGGITSGDSSISKMYSSNVAPAAGAGSQYDVSYEHDNDGRVSRIYVPYTYPSYDYTLQYDGMGRLWKIFRTGVPNPDYQFTYDPASNVTRRDDYVNNTSIDYTPDALNRTTYLQVNVPTSVIPRGWFTQETYGYDMVNRLISVTRGIDGSHDQFWYYLNGELFWVEYDPPGPVTNVMRSFRYDLDYAGNRTGVAQYDQNNALLHYSYYNRNALNQYSTTAHDQSIANGSEHEISSYDSVQYAYLNDTYLSQATKTDTNGTSTYRLGYDALGRRVMSTFNNALTCYFYDGDRCILEFDAATRVATGQSIYGRGVDEIIQRIVNGTGEHPVQDREGNVIGVLGGDGSVLESYRYDAFGKPTMYRPDGSVITTGASEINNRFLFTGREYASKFGFYEYRARAYQPTIGRFMSEDPNLFVRQHGLDKPMADSADSKSPEAGGTKKATDEWSFSMHPDEAEWNLFRYCQNDPEDLVDPMGLQTILVEVPPVVLEGSLPKPLLSDQIAETMVPRGTTRVSPRIVDEAVRLNRDKNSVELPDGRRVDLRGSRNPQGHMDKTTQQRVPHPHTHDPKPPFKAPYENIPRGQESTPRQSSPGDIRDVIRHLIDKLINKN